MTVFFAFSDEVGKYKEEKTEKFLRAHPYYCRATVIIDAVIFLGDGALISNQG